MGKHLRPVTQMGRSDDGMYRREELCEPWRATLVLLTALPGHLMGKRLPLVTILLSVFGMHRRNNLCELSWVTLVTFTVWPGHRMEKLWHPVPPIRQSASGILTQDNS